MGAWERLPVTMQTVMAFRYYNSIGAGHKTFLQHERHGIHANKIWDQILKLESAKNALMSMYF